MLFVMSFCEIFEYFIKKNVIYNFNPSGLKCLKSYQISPSKSKAVYNSSAKNKALVCSTLIYIWGCKWQKCYAHKKTESENFRKHPERDQTDASQRLPAKKFASSFATQKTLGSSWPNLTCPSNIEVSDPDP